MTDFNQKTHDTDVGSHGGQSWQMMEVFENQEFGSIRLLQEAGKTFFCASNVAKALYEQYKTLRQDMIAYQTAKQNVDRILGLEAQEQEQKQQDSQTR